MKLFSFLFLISAFNGVFLAVILGTSKIRKIDKNTFLSILIVVISAFLFKQFLLNEYGVSAIPHLIGSLVPLLFLIGPLFYLFIKFEVKKNLIWTNQDYINFVPALICLISILPYYLKTGNEKYLLYTSGHHYFPFKGIYYWSFGILITYYSYLAIKFVRQNSVYSDGRTQKKFSSKKKWVKHFILLFTIVSFSYLIGLCILSFTKYEHTIVFLSVILAFSLLIHFVGFWSIKESKIRNSSAKPSSKISLSEKKIKQIKNDIISLLENEEVYKINGLSSNFFCKKLIINSQYLSFIVNKEFNCSLTYLVNSYRICEAKKMIKNETYDHLSLLGIAMEVGFNTKNTFTRVFKKHTGMTPIKFKNMSSLQTTN